jgi:uncharacterized protein YggE
MKRIVIAACLLLAAAAVAGVARPEGSHAAQSADTPARTVTVTGTGTAKSTPARAGLSFGVQVQASSAKSAIQQNAAAMRKVLAALQDAGADDLRTDAVTLSPVYGDDQTLQGYVAGNTVSATVTYAAAGSTIDAAVDAGANQVNGPSPLAGDADALYRKALADAVADAREHGQALADAAGAKLGEVISLVEGGAAPIPFAAADKAVGAGSTPVVPGTLDTSATVTVTFALA